MAIREFVHSIVRIGFECDIHLCAMFQRYRLTVRIDQPVLNPNFPEKVVCCRY
jgi:hypothetical protein